MPDLRDIICTFFFGLGGLAAAALLGRPLLAWLGRLQVGQQVRELGPKSHYKKSGTPTFGGFIFMLPITVGTVVIALGWPGARGLIPLLIYALALLATGFADDYVKVRINKKGLSPLAKSIPMFVATAAFVLWYLSGHMTLPVLLVPFTKLRLEITGWWRLPYAVFAFLYLYYIANSVNITDGVDGLLSSVTIPVALLLGLGGELLGLPGTGGYARLGSLMTGALLGFLIYNRHPARVFMGDTGSLALGGLLAGMGLVTGSPWIFLSAGFIFCAESLSVIIQRAYYRRTGGRRIFRMSPIHHHFELGGWPEPVIVRRFTLVTVLGSLLGLAAWWLQLG
ncbi:MAG: phospho-N-acetylmuramoyl-pentapeptide-transferase [Bacillota bacterium]|nr:phospho-N-acetylmuramoyl-pentapeptide-transferase [Bacillota bacterium]